jgi:hypothetical protein
MLLSWKVHVTLSVLSVGASGTSGGLGGGASMRGGAWDRSGDGWDGISELNTVKLTYSPG